MADIRIDRDKYQARFSSLKTERTSWESYWGELTDFILPYSGRFFAQDRNRGTRRFNNIYDPTATLNANILSAGLMAGMTSPARPWFRLATPDPALMQYHSVKVWLSDVTKLMLDVFARSNTYDSLQSMYQDLGVYGTATSFVHPDFKNVIHHSPLPMGEYYLATGPRGEVDTLYREFDMTVSQMVKMFGMDKVSETVRSMYTSGNLDTWVTVVQCVEPNVDRDPKMRDARNMAWTSVYFEKGQTPEKYLRRSGFEEYPALSPRWQVWHGDVYGIGPGGIALGSVKGLQHRQLRLAEGLDYTTKPPVQVPTALKNQDVDMLPGGVTYVDGVGQNPGIRTAWEVRLDLAGLQANITDTREILRSCFYADLFLMMANVDVRMTATEVAERHEEKLLMLGPVLQRLHNEMLDPMVEMAFHRLAMAGALPPPPPELEGVDLNIEFVSMLAQAQRAIGVNSTDRYVMTLGQVAAIKPEVLDRLDADALADSYADQLGVDPRLIVPLDKAVLVRQQRAQQQAVMQAAATAEQAATAAQRLGAVQTGERNAASDLINQFQGYTIPQ